MTEHSKTTIESSGVEERLEKLAVSPLRHSEERSETPPSSPRGQTSSFQSRVHHSSPCLSMETSPKLQMSPKFVYNSVRHHELTPIMRNTNVEYVEGGNQRIVSPESSELHGESLLSLPSATSLGSKRPALKRRSVNSQLSLPPIPMGDRTKSLGHVEEFSGEDDDDDEDDVRMAIPFPSRKKFFSFNSRHQYHSQTNLSDSVPMQTSHEEPHNLTPYQPSRQDLSDVGALPDEELSRIFIHKNPIPLEERQWSIPSIHMANVLNGSTTDYTDEEDDLKDDASWSTRGSSLFLPEDNDNSATQLLKFTPTGMKPVVILEGQLPGEIVLPIQHSDGTVNAVKRTKHDQAYEWLRTVETGGQENIAEAASSKFLTRTGAPEMIIARQKSSPAAAV